MPSKYVANSIIYCMLNTQVLGLKSEPKAVGTPISLSALTGGFLLLINVSIVAGNNVAIEPLMP